MRSKQSANAARIDRRRQQNSEEKTLAKLQLVEKEKQRLDAVEKPLREQLERLENPGEYLVQKAATEKIFEITRKEAVLMFKQLGLKFSVPTRPGAWNLANLGRLTGAQSKGGPVKYIVTVKDGMGDDLARVLRRKPKVKETAIKPRVKVRESKGVSR